MRKCDFPSYEMHKTAHDIFLADYVNKIKLTKDYLC